MRAQLLQRYSYFPSNGPRILSSFVMQSFPHLSYRSFLALDARDTRLEPGLWKHISGKVSGKAALECAVISQSNDRTILTTYGLMFVPLHDELEAHFVCAILNSSIAHLVVMSYAREVHLTTDVMKYVFVPD